MGTKHKSARVLKRGVLHAREHGFRYLHAVHFASVAGLSYLLAVVFVVAYVLSPVWIQHSEASGYSVFSPQSFWNTTIARYPTLNTSTAIVDAISTSALSSTRFDTTDQGAAVYTAGPSDATVSVTAWDCAGSGADNSLNALWQAVPIPYYAAPGGSAGSMIVYQPTTGTMWEFGRMQQVAGQWQACTGGRIDNTSAQMGIFGGSYGVLESGFALLGGQISIQELKRGYIGHAVGLSVPQVGPGTSWPANRSVSGSGFIDVGQRLQLDPSLNIDSLGLSSTARIIAKAAQKYGFVVWGYASQPTVIGESPVSSTARGLPNPYGSIGSTSLSGFPWDKLRALPADYGQSGAPPSIATFSASSTQVTAGDRVDFSWSAIDIDECAIPSVGSHLPNAGVISQKLIDSTSAFSLVCSGPGGSVSRQLQVGATSVVTNDPVPESPAMAVTISSFLSGEVVLLPDLAAKEAAATVQKIGFYERNVFLQSTTTPPFLFDTRSVADGKHVLGIKVYYRDGRTEYRTAAVKVQNDAEQISLPTAYKGNPQSPKVPLLYGISIMLCVLIMVLSALWGWRSSHPMRLHRNHAYVW